MKKTFFLFLLAASVALVSCDNKPAQSAETTEAVDTTTTPEAGAGDSAVVEDEGVTGETGDNGTASMPANVFENSSGKPLAGATVQAKSGTTVVQTVTTDASGNYQFTQLVSGTSYSFRASKQGYSPQTKSASFSGTNSLPWFGMQ